MTGCVQVKQAREQFDNLDGEVAVAENYANQVLTLIADMKRDIRDGMLNVSVQRLSSRVDTLQWMAEKLDDCVTNGMMWACAKFEQAMGGELETEEEAEA